MKGRKSSETMFMNEAEEEKIRKTMSTITKDGESVDDVDKIWQSEVSDWEDVKNPVLRRMAKALVCVRCLPPERTDATTRNVLLRVFQRLSILADLAAACVAILTFNSVSYCCNEPILNFRDMDWPWQKLTKVLVYLYLVLVLCEIYPVVKRGFPFNIVSKSSSRHAPRQRCRGTPRGYRGHVCHASLTFGRISPRLFPQTPSLGS